ncbi:MAG: Rossmann fold nucleotide-binding protein Smf possibly involved in DNA uptake [uncultured Aureispira sp.]|uniref:Rossmann fold nucleotide-binding protein Smf possibly involved in DNA uptake n=1 Tax=uncultured Aureispira sp. TaxID=1331704 RepID=A0A6S6UA10_9BACT|nr:MAG: Rossmann fold nucleotide-binding protein Smf possibly involved in DNA uptake [uncultured Aureispira sp.]
MTLNQEVVGEELIYRIALNLIPQLGNKTAFELLRHFGSAQAVFEQSKEADLHQVPKIGQAMVQQILEKSTLEKAAEEWAFTQKYNIKVLPQESADYPKRLRNCPDAPFLLYYKGNTNLNAAKVVAIVGTRKPSAQGKLFCERLVQDLAVYNPLIVSGLAYGIDVTAHKKCLDLQLPNIGVVAHGLDRIYPKMHKTIAQRMTNCGGILTEFRKGVAPFSKHFPMRNRIIAGMADAVVVVETANRGGSMITAYIANEYNKDVFAVPGRLDDPLSKGCNHLIKTHRASLLESAEDLAYILRWEKKAKGQQKQLFANLSKEERLIVDLMLGKEVHLEMIIQKTKISTSRMAALLLELELRGVIRALPGNNFRLL